ncbi:hypothetical protein KIPB_012735 [Kipferlia bialata]|uniref:Transmembrane protein n=1 Tax=Kipferlia bialata TaxID=797122 RepID=A0A9K3D8B3_9EUKA|nr:hypothetical protein KIPB_012735 [Kipferlia bialata]|eukprot:g12735.t1
MTIVTATLALGGRTQRTTCMEDPSPDAPISPPVGGTQAAPTEVGTADVPFGYTWIVIILLELLLIRLIPSLSDIYWDIYWLFSDAGLFWMSPIFNGLLIVGGVFLFRYLVGLHISLSLSLSR